MEDLRRDGEEIISEMRQKLVKLRKIVRFIKASVRSQACVSKILVESVCIERSSRL